MKIRGVCIFALLLFCFDSSWSQAVYSGGLLPQVNLNTTIARNWRLNAKVESRQILSEGKLNEDFKTNYRYDLTDIALIASKNIAVNTTLGAGYMIRLSDDKAVHRFIQQYSIVKKYDVLRLGHRISTDQTIEDNKPVRFRLRYRIGVERALSGKDVDPGEFYFRINNEYLFSLEGKETGLELRLIPVLGYAFNDNNKLEFGIDYRKNKLSSDASVTQFWLYLGWFITLAGKQ